MTTAPVLLVMGHRLCSALLVEAAAALDEDDWDETVDHLKEFVSRLERHIEAEHGVLFPHLSRIDPTCEPTLDRYRQEHVAIGKLMHSCLDNAVANDSEACGASLEDLTRTLKAHCREEERLVYTLAQKLDQVTVRELAQTLAPMAE